MLEYIPNPLITSHIPLPYFFVEGWIREVMTCINTSGPLTGSLAANTDWDVSCDSTTGSVTTSVHDTSGTWEVSWSKQVPNHTSESIDSECSGQNDHRNLIVFDYDDTLFPTTFLAQRGYRLDGPRASSEIESLLDDYSTVVECTLLEAERHGRVVILTNAESGWISLTSQKFMPRLAKVLDRYPAISARSTYEPLGVVGPFNWKLKAFQALLSEYSAIMKATCIRNIVSLGDSLHERDAVQQASSSFERFFCKSIKLIERPDITELMRQHQLIQDCFTQVISHDGTLDLCVQNQDEVVSTFS